MGGPFQSIIFDHGREGGRRCFGPKRSHDMWITTLKKSQNFTPTEEKTQLKMKEDMTNSGAERDWRVE